MLRIAICDDEPVFLSEIEKDTSDYFSSVNCDVEISCFHTGKELLFSDKSFQLYLLDIMLPEFSGLELADLIRSRNPECAIIFISSMHNAVFDSIRYAPLRFIRKEKRKEELPEALSAFLQAFQKANRSISLSFKGKNFDTAISVSDILYLESIGHYLNVHSLDRTLKVRGQISQYQEKLAIYSFSRASHGILVNLRFVSYLSGSLIILSNGEQITLTRTCKNTFVSDYMKFQREVIHAISI